MVFTLYVRVVLPSGPANFVLAMEDDDTVALLKADVQELTNIPLTNIPPSAQSLWMPSRTDSKLAIELEAVGLPGRTLASCGIKPGDVVRLRNLVGTPASARARAPWLLEF